MLTLCWLHLNSVAVGVATGLVGQFSLGTLKTTPKKGNSPRQDMPKSSMGCGDYVVCVFVPSGSAFSTGPF